MCSLHMTTCLESGVVSIETYKALQTAMTDIQVYAGLV